MRIFVTAVLLISLSLCGAALTAKAPSRDSQWKKVRESMEKGLPKSAIAELQPIAEAAIQDKAYDEAIKALAMIATLESNIQGNKPQEKIVRFQEALKDAPDEMKPMMEAILGHWYWHFFQRMRWSFMQRTQIDQPGGDDIMTWSLPRILAEIDTHYTRALAAKEQLRKIPVADYSQLLAEGTLPDTYRPTLYDFVANEALAFYRAGEQAGAKSQDEFVLQADSPIFGSIDDFVVWKVETTDTDSPVIKAIGIYQDLLGYHANDDDPGALADADLGRLQYGYNQASGEEKNARYKAALKKFAQKWADHQLSAHAKYLHAQVLHTEGDLVAARKIALEGTTAFPESVGGKLCFNLIQQIEAKSLGITCERTWTNPWPEIQVQYRNITKVHFRAVPYEWRKLVQQPNFRPNSIQRQLNDELLKLTPAKSWSADLPATDDYQQTVERLTVPRDLKPGFYFLIASQREDFGETDNQVSVNEFWVSPLALVLRRGQGAQTSGFVLDADSGDPIRQAQVVVWNSDRRQRKYTALRTVRTDENGYFSIQAEQGKRYLFEARHEGAQLVTASESVAGRTSTSRPYERTVLFTDRSLYRPGQTIQYKGICIAVDQENDNYRTLGGKSVTVVFRDVNNQEIAKQVHRTNDFGSFNGSFTAPRDRLTGRMRIVDAERRNSQTLVSVEEYKRPKFRVELAAPDKPARLNDQVQLTGTATAYTGAPIGNAKVQYRVIREVRYPIWWAWRFWWRPQTGNSQEIAHGSARTDREGKFDIQFFARPDPSVSEEDEPQFRFTVHADVTDITGETRSDQRMVNVGFTALSATMSADSWQTSDKPVQLTIRTKSLDSEGRKANGTIKVHRLQEPDEVHRPPIQPMQYYPRSGRGGEPEADLSDPNSWPLGPVVIEEAFATDDTGAATLALDMKAGTYRVLLDTKDAFGKAVTAVLPVQVLDANADRLGTKVPFVLRAPKSNLEPNETYLAIWGTGYESGRAYIEVEHRGKILQSYWTPARTTQSVIEQGVTEAMRGGFTVRVTMVRENRAYLETQNIEVPWTNKQLQVKWEHFVSKLKPGGEESWSAIITGPQAKQAVAEMVAAMYDASLDAYLPHNWPNLQVFRRTYSRLGSQFQNFAVNLRHVRGNWDQQHKNVQITYRSYPPEIRQLLERFEFFRANRRMRGAMPAPAAMSGGGDMAPGMAMDGATESAMALGESVEMSAKGAAPAEGRGRGGGAGGGQPPAVDLSSVSARANLNETAFFFPHLKSDEQGKVTLEFTMPEALTEWKFLGFAHDQQLRSGVLLDTAVTSKDLMVEPLAPRFVREGDELEFTVKVTNRSAARQMGTVRLSLADARTLDPVDVQLSNSEVDRPFDVPANESRSYSWRLKIPDGMGFLIYKAVGSTGRLSDGEEGYLPVLSRRILVTESLPLPIRGPGSATFSFEKLLSRRQLGLARASVVDPPDGLEPCLVCGHGFAIPDGVSIRVYRTDV